MNDAVSSIEQVACSFATRAHGDQKYGDLPYVEHLSTVREVLVEFGWSGDYLVAAWLHDVLEDTDTKREMIELVFGPTVTSYVWAVTGKGGTRHARNEDARAKMLARPDAIPLKLADRIANGRAARKNNSTLLTMYSGEYPVFKNKLHPVSHHDPRLVMMWAELDHIFRDVSAERR